MEFYYSSLIFRRHKHEIKKLFICPSESVSHSLEAGVESVRRYVSIWKLRIELFHGVSGMSVMRGMAIVAKKMVTFDVC